MNSSTDLTNQRESNLYFFAQTIETAAAGVLVVRPLQGHPAHLYTQFTHRETTYAQQGQLNPIVVLHITLA